MNATLETKTSYLQDRRRELTTEITRLQQEPTIYTGGHRLRVVVSVIATVALIIGAGYSLLTFQFLACAILAPLGMASFLMLGPLAERSLRAQNRSFDQQNRLSTARRQLRSIDALIEGR